MLASGSLQVLRPEWPDLPARAHALTTLRGGGVSAAPYGDGAGGGGLNLGDHVGDAIESVRRNRALLQALLPAAPAWLAQVHGTTVHDTADAADPANFADQADSCADASIAVGAGAVCAILTADCLPVLFCDRSGGVVGAAHAGWRGLLNGVLENTVRAMQAAGAGEISAWLGPAIGPEQFEVGPEVRAAYLARDARHAAAFRPVNGKPEKYMADIYRLARLALAGCGVGRVSGGGFCTVSDAARFYSYRRDGVTGRFASLIWIA
ncbi:peptidoglycan editing factor PgeF [Oxalobacteraceae bacterium CAVE-383]|nr:peptidoglycan editing factor PgeF [Oxalobacteraceae bacterium CAVE-383]